MTAPSFLSEGLRRLDVLARSKWANWIGLGLSVLALTAFLAVAAKTISADDVGLLVSAHWPVLVVTLFLYVLNFIPMSGAWAMLAQACGASISTRELRRIFVVSQIGKYLPGNVGQFVGRVWLGQARGVAVAISARAMALEVAGVLAACSILAGLALGTGLIHSGGAGEDGFVLPLAIGVTAVASLVGAVLAFQRRGERQLAPRHLLSALASYLLVLAMTATANVLLVSTLSGQWDIALAARVAGAFAVSWLVGFVTPGAPAGIGLRELTFFSILAGSYPSELLVMAATAYRLTTVTGDVLAWAFGMLTAVPSARERRIEAA